MRHEHTLHPLFRDDIKWKSPQDLDNERKVRVFKEQDKAEKQAKKYHKLFPDEEQPDVPMP